MTNRRVSIDSSTTLPSISHSLSRPTTADSSRRISMQGGQRTYQQQYQQQAAYQHYGGAGHHSSDPSPSSPTPTAASHTLANVGKSKKDSKDKKRRKASMSIGDDLPHMPSSPPSRIVDSAATLKGDTSRVKFVSSPTAGAEGGDDKFTAFPPPSILRNSVDSPHHHDALTAALHGSNSMLVDREVSRLRDRGAKELKMKKRIWAGVATLLLMIFSTYIMAQYIIAWLSLAPATVLLSEAVQGTSVSPDPQLRTFALLCIALSSASVAGMLVVAWYLRASRRRSCGTAFTYLIAIISVMLGLALALANLLFIVLWRKQYAARPNDPLARTRDVGTRCVGRWDLDVLWSAASNSQTSDDQDTVSHCAKDPNQAMKLYLTAGGFRLVLLVFLCTFWLVLLRKYNKALGVNSLDGVDGKESAEMHVLLAEEEKGLSFGAGKMYDEGTAGDWGYAGDGDEVDPAKMRQLEEEDEDQTLTPSNARAYAAISREEEDYYSEEDDEKSKRTSLASMPVPLPRLNRFDWQRGEPSMAGEYHPRAEQNHHLEPPMPQAATYGHGHAKESSAGGWSAGLFARLGDAVGWHAPTVQHHGEDDGRVPDNFGGYAPPSYTTTTYANHAPHSSSHAYAPEPVSHGAASYSTHGAGEHDRAPTKLGVSAWFRRDPSDSVDESHYAPPPPPQQQQRAHYQQPAPSHVQQQQQAAYAHAQQQAFAHTQQQAHAQQQQQQASPRSIPPPRPPRPDSVMLPPQTQQQQDGGAVRRESLGNDLPHMPSAATSMSAPPSATNTPSSKSPRTRAREMSEQYSAPAYATEPENEDEFWKGGNDSEDGLGALPSTDNAPTYVRTLGRLVHRLSAIESVGSGERGSEGSTNAPPSARGSEGGARHGKGMSWGLGTALGFGEGGAAGEREAPGGWMPRW